LKRERPNIFAINEKEILFWGFNLHTFNIETNEFTSRDEVTGYGLTRSDEMAVQVLFDITRAVGD
jgi:hypothetical protein